jgi:MoxR-like ATPase
MLDVAGVGGRADRIVAEVEKAVVGKRDVLELVLMGILADGHVLIEDYPGLAKTLMARSFARVMDLGFARVQFTPDLMPADVTGSSIFNQKTAAFEFRPGPVFTNLLLGDEINRAPPKTQAALLEAMQERQVTVEGQTHLLARPFIVLATENPIEYEGTYPLPEAQLDRFMIRVAVGYPSRDDEWGMARRRLERKADEVDLETVIDGPGLLEMQRAVEEVHTLALIKLTRCRAALRQRDYVVPDDVKALAAPVLAHRLTLQPELWVQQVSPHDIVDECLESVPTPAAEDITPSGP